MRNHYCYCQLHHHHEKIFYIIQAKAIFVFTDYHFNCNQHNDYRHDKSRICSHGRNSHDLRGYLSDNMDNKNSRKEKQGFV